MSSFTQVNILHTELFSGLYYMIFFYFTSVYSLFLRWARSVARTGKIRGVYRVLVGKLEERRPLGRPRRRWEDNIKTYIQEMGCGGIDWNDLAQDRDRWRALVTAVMKRRVP